MDAVWLEDTVTTLPSNSNDPTKMTVPGTTHTNINYNTTTVYETPLNHPNPNPNSLTPTNFNHNNMYEPLWAEPDA